MLKRISVCAAVAILAAMATAIAGPGQDSMLSYIADLAKEEDPSFTGFSAAAGKAFFLANHSGGNPDTPSCSTCHTTNPRKVGETRVGKPIDPMAVSVSPKRFSDLAKVEKWLRRNCNTVLGHQCAAQDAGNVITWLNTQ